MRSRIPLAFAVLCALSGAALAQSAATPGITPLHPDLAARTFDAACSACHYRGAGKPAFEADSPLASSKPDALVQVILFGKGPDEGRAGMPAFGKVLTDADVTRLVVWLRTTAQPKSPWTKVAARVTGLRASGQRGD